MSQQQYQRELNRTQLPTLWTIPEKMWQQIRPLLPPEKEPGTPGRTPVPFRKVMNGILFVLRTGCQWKALPKKAHGSGSTVHRRFQQWTQAGIIDAIVEPMLRWYVTDAAGSTGSGKRPTPSCWQPRWEARRRALTPPTEANRGPSGTCWSMGEASL
jgi:transposase